MYFEYHAGRKGDFKCANSIGLAIIVQTGLSAPKFFVNSIYF